MVARALPADCYCRLMGPVLLGVRHRHWLLLLGVLIAAIGWTPRGGFDARHKPALAVVDLPPSPSELSTNRPPATAEVAARAAATDLFTFLPSPIGAAAIASRIPAATHTIHYVNLNRDLIAGKGSVFWRPGRGLLHVPLPDGRRLSIEITQTASLGPDRFTSQGHILDQPGSRATFAYNGGLLTARLEDRTGNAFELRPVADQKGTVVNQFYAVDPTLFPGCGGHLAVSALAEPSLARRLATAAARTYGAEAETNASASPPVAAASTTDGDTVTLDLLMAYTSAVRTSLGSTALVQVQLDLGVARVNRDFEASDVNARIRLADSLEVIYPGDEITSSQSEWQSNALSRLRGLDDAFMDEVHAKRDEIGADLVTLVMRRPDPGSSGIAYLLGEARDYVGPYFAFSVVNISSMAGPILSHELAHNLGAAHARGDPGASGTLGGAYPYSFGYRFNSLDDFGRSVQLRTIMAYSPGSRIGYFSNPRLRLPSSTSAPDGSASTTANGPALGIPEGQPGAADNALTLRQNAFQVAQYRAARDGGYAGRLLNVSTRAWVGADDRRMIGGFVLAGTGPRHVLIRAVGPRLASAPYLVPGTLADPTLEVIDNSTGLPVAANDNWFLTPDGGLAVAVAARNAAAFELANGSTDAALVALLAPGSYTAVVGGKSGTGIALVEAYGVAPADSRQINLSTRAYGSSSLPIIAGFVVGPENIPPGGTKRIFLRALGPSLASFGLAEDTVMQDPLLQLYDHTGILILENDDWDPPTTALGLNLPTIRRGIVDQPNEQAVFDAIQRLGTIPQRPVEPGVIVDLRPGAYTLFVTPFELLPNQPAVPGLALVEVYELTPE